MARKPPPTRASNMRELTRALDAALLPQLRGWTGETITRLHWRDGDHEVWTMLFGYPAGYGRVGTLSIDAGAAPPLPGDREATLRSLCNGWNPAGLAHHVPTCWRQRFPEVPMAYAGIEIAALIPQLVAVFDDIAAFARQCTLAQLGALGEQMMQSEYAFERDRGRAWVELAQRVLTI